MNHFYPWEQFFTECKQFFTQIRKIDCDDTSFFSQFEKYNIRFNKLQYLECRERIQRDNMAAMRKYFDFNHKKDDRCNLMYLKVTIETAYCQNGPKKYFLIPMKKYP